MVFARNILLALSARFVEQLLHYALGVWSSQHSDSRTYPEAESLPETEDEGRQIESGNRLCGDGKITNPGRTTPPVQENQALV